MGGSVGRGSTPPGGQREGLPGKVTWNLGHHTLPSPGRGWRQRQTRPPTSVPGPCPLPYFLSLAICSQDAIAKGIFAPSTLLALQGPLRLRGNHTVPQTGKLLSSLSLCTHPPRPILSPLSHLRQPPQAPRALEARAVSLSLTPVPSTCLEQEDAQVGLRPYRPR